ASNISADNNFTSYGFTMYYNPELLSYGSYSSSGTLSQNGSIGIGNQPGILEVSCTLSNPLQGMGELLKFNFSTLQAGHSTLVAQNFHFNGNPISSVLPGSVRIDAGSNLVGDTLTIIQHPILNIPEIVIPGELMTITCLAPESTTGWQATLKHGSKSISLPVLSSQYVLSPNRWLLSTQIPNVPVFELYNLEVTANGGIQDLTRNAVQVVPSRKSSYYFVHVTDTHMPGRTFYPDAGYQTDSTSVMDFRAVLEDINIIRPEFVLLTGDLINEGELEDFAGLNSYGWAQKVLSELEVPVYLTSGNHDIGGWDSTPAPQGSARRNWWRYFGWNWLDNPDYSWGNHHQDYSFTYGNTHYIGLESYDNYDSWRYMIYGAQSYTPNQLAWLSGQLNLFPGYRKVLFHHYDFSSQLNLNTLGIDMALWGHIHSNSGSISTYPYDLATRSTCDGNRAYRVIKVTETNLQPLTTIYAGSTGSTISQTFHPNNYGLVDSVRAVVYNGQNISFDNALVKFKMPGGNANYTVSNGSLEQVDRSGLYNICYVKINLPASSNLQVSIKANDTSTGDTDLVPPLEYKLVAFPNPFTSSVYFSLTGKGGPQPRIEIYNLKGQKLSSLELSAKEISWTPQNLASGIYFVKLLDGTKVLETRKITFINR
ncbi:MAG: metallophosphoesterase, partial [Candidatus Cloacimonetes bacterium]|nr:metallophosphoesterase [Candidatus Cloacimonadota bacterium]